jgi:hypothetical protein
VPRNVKIGLPIIISQVITGFGALASFAYYLTLRNALVPAGRWAVFSGVLTIATGLLNLTVVLRAQPLREAVSLRIAIVVSMPCPLILAGLTLIGIGLDSDRVLVFGSALAVAVFLAGVALFIRYVYAATKRG